MKKIYEQKFLIAVLLLGTVVLWKMHFDNTLVNVVYGVADTKETVLTSRFPVIITSVHVVPGQRVGKGDLLVESKSPQLELEILKLKNELSGFLARRAFNRVMNDHLEGVDLKTHPKYAYTNPLKYQIANLERQIRVLEDDLEALDVYAETDSVVGVVNVRPGEKLAAFAPYLTIVKNTPLFVRGYIHEYVNTETFKHQRVTLHSFTRPSEGVDGSLMEIGDRIVPFPSQLLRGEAQLWGREVIVALPPGNEFRVGEKLILRLGSDELRLRDPRRQQSLLSKSSKETREKSL